MRTWSGLAAVTALMATGWGAQAQNLILNGGFERPVVPVGSFSTFSLGGKLGQWKVVGALGSVNVMNTHWSDSGFTTNAKAGQQSLDITGNSDNSPTGVAQTVDTVTGQSYELSFWVGNLYDTRPGKFGTASTINVLIDGVNQMIATNFSDAGTSQAWKKFSLTFVAQADRTQIAFINGDPPGDHQSGLDEVSLVATAR